MSAKIREEDVETLRLPRNWHSYVRTAVLNVVGIVRIAIVERFHRTLKEILCPITVPEHQPDFEYEVGLAIDWYNEHRPHETLGGKTPNEVYFSRPPENEQPRIEPRRKWPRGSPCAKPMVGIEGDPGAPIIVEIDCREGRRHLPIISVRRAA